MEDLPGRQQLQVSWPQVLPRHRRIVVVGIVLVLWMVVFSAVVGGVAGYIVAGRVANGSSPFFSTITNSAGKTIQVTNEESAVINVVSKASPAVVSIVAKGVNPFSGNLSTQSAGTGMLVDSNGTVVTNSHVVEDATSTYTVVTHDQKTYTAKNISRDPVNDVAVLKIDGSNFPTVVFGDSSAIKVGQSVVAIGNALGQFDNTVTTGVVSGVGRGITASDQLGQNSESLEGLIQTDAAINPGNSGGPLLSLGGDAIGITTAAASGAQNIGFAVPVNTVKAILSNYEKNGHIVRPFLGVGTVIVSSSEATANGLVVGALVQEVVPNSGADTAGIQRSDIIQAVNGQSISESNPLAKVLSQFQVGQQVNVKIWRGGKTQTVTAALSESPNN
jgi:serine protease Do